MQDLYFDRSGDNLSELRRGRVDHFVGPASSHLGTSPPSAVARTHTIPHTSKLGQTFRLHPIIRNGLLRRDLPIVHPPLTRFMFRLSPRRRARRPHPQPRSREEETTKSRRCVPNLLCTLCCSGKRDVGGLERRFQEETGRRI